MSRVGRDLDKVASGVGRVMPVTRDLYPQGRRSPWGGVGLFVPPAVVLAVDTVFCGAEGSRGRSMSGRVRILEGHEEV